MRSWPYKTCSTVFIYSSWSYMYLGTSGHHIYYLLSVLMYSGEPSSRTRVPTCFTTCWMKFLQSVWPTLRWCLTFTIPNKGIFGTVFQLLGCLLAYLSAFTISYQVYIDLATYLQCISITTLIQWDLCDWKTFRPLVVLSLQLGHYSQDCGFT